MNKNQIESFVVKDLRNIKYYSDSRYINSEGREIPEEGNDCIKLRINS